MQLLLPLHKTAWPHILCTFGTHLLWDSPESHPFAVLICPKQKPESVTPSASIPGCNDFSFPPFAAFSYEFRLFIYLTQALNYHNPVFLSRLSCFSTHPCYSYITVLSVHSNTLRGANACKSNFAEYGL